MLCVFSLLWQRDHQEERICFAILVLLQFQAKKTANQDSCQIFGFFPPDPAPTAAGKKPIRGRHLRADGVREALRQHQRRCLPLRGLPGAAPRTARSRGRGFSEQKKREFDVDGPKVDKTWVGNPAIRFRILDFPGLVAVSTKPQVKQTFSRGARSSPEKPMAPW